MSDLTRSLGGRLPTLVGTPTEQQIATESAAGWSPGQVIAGLYEVVDVLGRGGMGPVWRVRHQGWNADLAVKALSADLAADTGFREAFVRECQAWVGAGLHPHVVPCCYVRDLGGVPRLFIECVDGGSLAQVLAQGAIPDWASLFDLALQCLDGLSHAHGKGLLHRNLKPANCLLTADGELRISDFGIASGFAHLGPGMAGIPARGDGRALMAEHEIVGSPSYMPPEQWDPRGIVGPWTDLYAFGIMLFEMVCGVRPFDDGSEAPDVLRPRHVLAEPPDPAGIRSQVPEALAAFIRKCLGKKPEERPACANAARDELALIHEAFLGRPYRRPKRRDLDLVPDSLNLRAVSLVDLGSTVEAVAAWDRALAVDPMHAHVRFNRGLVRWRRAQVDDLAVLDQVGHARKDWKRPWALYHLGALVHMERDDLASAVACTSGILESSRHDASVAALLDEAQRAASASGVSNFLESTLSFERASETIGAAFVQGGRQAVLIRREQGLCLDLESGTVGSLALDGPVAIAATPDGSRALVGRVGSVGAWVQGRGLYVHTYELPMRFAERSKAEVPLVAMAPRGTMGAFVVRGDPTAVRVWRIGSDRFEIDEAALGRLRVKLPVGRVGTLIPLVGQIFTHQQLSTQLAEILEEADARVVMAEADRRVRVLAGHSAPITALCFSPDGSRLISGGSDGSIRVWSASTGDCVLTSSHGEAVRGLAVAADGSMFVCAGDRSLAVRHLAGGDVARRLESFHRDEVVSVWWTPGGIFTAARDMSLKLHHPVSGRILRTFGGIDRSGMGAVLGDGRRAIFVTGEHELGYFTIDATRFGRIAGLAISRSASVEDVERRQAHWRGLLSGVDDCILRKDWAGAQRMLEELIATGENERTPELLDRVRSLYTAWKKASLRAVWPTWSRVPHAGRVNAVAISGNGSTVVTAGADGRICLFRLPHGETGPMLHGPWGPTLSIAVDFDGCLVVSGHEDGMARLWEVTTRRCLQSFEVGSPVEAVCLSRDGRWVVTGAANGAIQLWDVTSARALRSLVFDEPPGPQMQLFWNFEAGILCGRRRGAFQWSLAEGRQVMTAGQDGLEYTHAVAVPDVRMLLVGASDGTLKVWDADKMQVEEAGRMPRGTACAAVAMGADGRWGVVAEAAAAGRTSATLHLWDAANRRLVKEMQGHVGEIAALQMSPDGAFVLSASQDGILRCWFLEWATEPPEGGAVEPLVRNLVKDFLKGATPYAAELPPPGRELVDADVARALARTGPPQWDAASFARLMVSLAAAGYGSVDAQVVERTLLRAGGRLQAPPPSATPSVEPPAAPVSGIAPAFPTSPRAAGVRRVEPRRGEAQPAAAKLQVRGVRLLHASRAHEGGASAVACSEDGLWGAAGGADGSIRILDLEQGTCVATLGREAGWSPVGALVFSREATLLYTAHADGGVRAWEREGGALRTTLKERSTGLVSIALHPEGTRLLCGSDYGETFLWDLEEERCLHVMQGPQELVRAVAFGSGDRLVTAGEGAVRLWEGEGFQTARELVGHTQPVTCLATAANGRLVLSGSADHTLRLWDIVGGGCLRLLHHEMMGTVTACALADDGVWAVSASHGRWMTWNLLSGTSAQVQQARTAALLSLAWDARSARLVGGEQDGSVSTWEVTWDEDASQPADVATTVARLRTETVAPRGRDALQAALREREQRGWGACRALRSTELAHVLVVGAGRGITGLDLTPDGERIVTSGRVAKAGQIHVLRLEEGVVERVIDVRRPLVGVWAAADNRTILSLGEDGTARVHDLEDGAIRREAMCRGLQTPLAVSGDLRVAASGYDKTTWQLWDVASGRLLRRMPGLRSDLVGITLSSDGLLAVTCSRDGWVQAWDVVSGSCVSSMRDSSGWVAERSLAFSPLGGLAVWENDREDMCFWPVASEAQGVSRGETDLRRSGPQASGGGRREAGSLESWSLVAGTKGAEKAPLISAVAFSLDGGLLALARGAMVEIRSVGGGARLGEFLGHPCKVVAVRFGADGRSLVTAGTDGLVKVWALRWGPALPHPAERIPGTFLDQFLRLHSPPPTDLASVVEMSEAVVMRWLRREGEPTWKRGDLESLRHKLRLAGFGDVSAYALQGMLQQEATRRGEVRARGEGLLKAAVSGHADRVSGLLRQGASLTVRDSQGATALHLAAGAGNTDIVKLLVQAGADLAAGDQDTLRPLHHAALAGQAECVVALLDAGADANAADARGRTALHVAAEAGRGGVIDVLMARGADSRAHTVKSDGEKLPLHSAASRKDAEAVEALCRGGADVLDPARNQCHALHTAAEAGNEVVVEALLRLGADVDARDLFGNTALHCAADNGHEAVIEALARAGAALEVANQQEETPLLRAVRSRRSEAARVLASWGADVEVLSEVDREILGIVPRKGGGFFGALGGLFGKSGPPSENMRDERGYSPVHQAVIDRDNKKLKALLAKGANPNLRDAEDRTPLYLAIANKNVEAVKALLDAGANPHFRFRDGRTLLNLCSHSGTTEIARLLKGKGLER